MRIDAKVFIFFSFLWLGLSGMSIWLVFKNTQNLVLTFLSLGSILALTSLTATLLLFFQKFNKFDQQRKDIENLRAEWQSTQESLKQLLDQRDQLGILVQLLHHFVLAATKQDVVLALLRELSQFLKLNEMEVVVFNEAIVYGAWEQITGQITVVEKRGDGSLPQWAGSQISREISQTQNSLLVPVVTEDSIIALMRLSKAQSNPFSVNEIRFLEAVANQTALALERVKLIAFLENLSLTDALTGVANRRHFEWRLAEEIERARRYHYPLSALMLDLDNFKQINDAYGHVIGDIVLQQIAQRLKGALRRTDFLARYGGEEFIVLTPQTTADRALILAERLRRTVAESLIQVADNLLLHVTISIGVAVFPEHAQNESELIQAADSALYKAKQMGRNRVCLFEPETKEGGEKNVRA